MFNYNKLYPVWDKYQAWLTFIQKFFTIYPIAYTSNSNSSSSIRMLFLHRDSLDSKFSAYIK